MNNTTDTAPTHNRGKSVVKNTHTDPSATDKPSATVINDRDTYTEEIQEELTANEQKFSSLVAQGYSATQAYRLAYPHKQELTNGTVRYNASKLLTKPNIATDISVKRTTLAHIARLAEDRIIETLTDGKLGSKAVTDVSLAMYEHANGKAKQQTEIISKSVSVNIDLTSATVEE